MPGAPFLYYGDELGMDYRALPSKEGGYHRTGSRTPMQWTCGKNLGFSDADADRLYLPVETGTGHCVEAQETDESSMLNFIRSLTALRRNQPDLQNYAPFEVYSTPDDSRLFAYKRGDLLIAMNPGTEELPLELDGEYTTIFTVGSVRIEEQTAILGAQSFAVCERNSSR